MEKHGMRDLLIEEVEAELRKSIDDIDPDVIDRQIDELCALEGISLPSLNDAALAAVARTIRARAAWRRQNTLAKEARARRFAHHVVHGAVAACCFAVFTLSTNYISALATGSCLLSKAGINICCGMPFCLCDGAETDHSK